MIITQKDKNRLIKQLYKRHKVSSKRRKKEYSLPLGIFKELSLSNCVYCGVNPSNIFKYSGLELKYSGIDRVDSSIGYVSDNCVSCCRFCNSLKGSLKAATWFDFLKAVILLNNGEIPDWYVGYNDPGRAKKSNWWGRR